MPEGADEEFAARALERAQKVARARGYIRSTMPTWGIDEERPARTADGSSEYAAIEVDGAGTAGGADSSARRARMRVEAYGRRWPATPINGARTRGWPRCAPSTGVPPAWGAS